MAEIINAQSLVSLNHSAAPNKSELFVQLLVAVGIVVLFVLGDFVKRGLRDEYVPVFYERAHVTEEEGEQQNPDVAAVHVRIVRRRSHNILCH